MDLTNSGVFIPKEQRIWTRKLCAFRDTKTIHGIHTFVDNRKDFDIWMEKDSCGWVEKMSLDKFLDANAGRASEK